MQLILKIKKSLCIHLDIYLFYCNPTGRFAMQAMKQMEPQMKQAIQSFPKTVGTSVVGVSKS